MPQEKENKLEKLKKNYELARKKYKLPAFDDIDDEFEIRKIDPDLNVVREVRRVIGFRLQGFADIFESILNPQPSSLHSMIETKIFEKHEIEPYFALYKKMWAFIHEGLHAWLQSEEKEAGYINKMWKEWPAIKPQMRKFFGKLEAGWQKTEKEKTENYVS